MLFRSSVYSLVTSSGIRIAAGRLAMPEGAVDDYIMVTNSQGIARWADPASGFFGDGWVGNEITDVANDTLTRSGLGTSGSPYEVAINLGNANTWTGAQTFNGVATMGNTLAVGANNITMTGSLGTNLSRLTAGWFTDLTVSNTISGNAGTATALAANGANCSAGSFPLGVSASGAAESCADDITGNAATATALAANGGNCSAGSFPLGVNASGAAESCDDNITGNAATATALAANGANCTAGSFPLGVNASGAVETCADNITGNAATATKPATAGPSGKVVCWRADGTLGQCSDAPTAAGCTCAAP